MASLANNHNSDIIIRRVRGEKRKFDKNNEWICYVRDNHQHVIVPIKMHPIIAQQLNTSRNDRLFLSFILTKNYPFECPKVTFNKQSLPTFYFKNFSNCGEIFEEDYKTLKSANCLCCCTILCPDNWEPTYSIKDVIDEFNKITSWKIKVVEKLMCRKVQEQLLPELPVKYYPIHEYL